MRQRHPPIFAALACGALTASLSGAPPGRAAAAETAPPSILQAADAAELREKFCAADPHRDHILVLPAALFVDADELVCPAGPYRLYRVGETGDPDDFAYFIDPPYGSTGRLGCDGKAGRRMPIIAVNCRPE